MQAEDLLPLGIIDEILSEPQGGAHHDPEAVYASVREAVVKAWKELKTLPTEELLENRYQKFRHIGEFAVE